MAQLNNITFDENGKILFVQNRISLKSDCFQPYERKRKHAFAGRNTQQACSII